MTKTRRRSGQPGSETPTDAILESISDGVFTVDDAWRVTSFNRAAERITGLSRKEALGQRCADVFRSSMCEASCALRRTLESGRPVIDRRCFIVDARGRRIPISVSTAVLRDESGTVVGGAETFRDLSEVEELRRELSGRFALGDLVSRSPLMRQVFDLVPAVAGSPSTVLIQGETGTGKELLARAIHDAGPRRDGPFVAVNCAAFPDTLLESELFGYAVGAFTGARRDKPGRFALARGGTLFLDEIGDVSPSTQVKLLRVLQDRVFEPLGATRSETTDARILTATNRDLATMVRDGAFREDLFYRVDVVRMDLPPLRRRVEDIPLLTEHFIDRLNRRSGRSVEGLSPEALAALMTHDWPGNVRELENVIERAFVLCRGSRVELTCLPGELTGWLGSSTPPDLPTTRSAVERHAIVEALRQSGGDRNAAARTLGVHRATLFRKMRRLKITDEGSRTRR